MKVSKQMKRVVGRVLDPPLMTYYRGTVTPRNGAWDMRSKKFCKGIGIDKWGILTGQPLKEG